MIYVVLVALGVALVWIGIMFLRLRKVKSEAQGLEATLEKEKTMNRNLERRLRKIQVAQQAKELDDESLVADVSAMLDELGSAE